MNAVMTDPSTPDVVALPEIAWIDGHPTINDPEARGTRLRRCIRCNIRDVWVVTCGEGLIVHLIDPDDIHAAPELFDGNEWAEPDTIRTAAIYWSGRGFRVTRKPGDVHDETVHPRFRACPACNEAEMRAGRLPVLLPRPPGAVPLTFAQLREGMAIANVHGRTGTVAQVGRGGAVPRYFKVQWNGLSRTQEYNDATGSVEAALLYMWRPETGRQG